VLIIETKCDILKRNRGLCGKSEKMEVYGVKPKKFTKEWWEYFWDYYKIHTIATIFVIIIVLSTVSECVNRVHYDMQVDFISELGLSEDAQTKLQELMSEKTEDITGNEKQETFLYFLNMSYTSDPQMEQAMQTKLMVETACSEAYVFILSPKYVDYFNGSKIFMNSNEWTDKESINGEVVSLKDSSVLKELGIDTENLYIGIRNIRKDEDADVAAKKQKNEIEFAKFLLN